MLPFRRRTSERQGPPPRRVLFVAGAILVSALGLRVYQHLAPPAPTKAFAVLNSASFTVEVADTPEKRELGLGGREGLPRRHAMYFPMPSEARWVFWMKGMRFPIDIIWLKDGIVVDVAKDVPPPGPDGELVRYAPSGPADAVLEVAAGVADELNVKPGDRVDVRS